MPGTEPDWAGLGLIRWLVSILDQAGKQARQINKMAELYKRRSKAKTGLVMGCRLFILCLHPAHGCTTFNTGTKWWSSGSLTFKISCILP